ncbi:hypothetical protein IJ670_05085, partial [bacterium]|nr:hypothetical protein [bacterium]
MDKSLIFLSVCFLVFIFISLFLALIMPPVEPDSQTYHFFRAFMYVKNHTLNHFDTNDIRALVMPINSEIFYSWMYVLKNQIRGFALFSWLSFVFCVLGFWQIFDYFKISYRKRLFAIFLFSSLASVIIQTSCLQTDLVVGGFFIYSLALFLKRKTYFSALSLALALGIKSTACMMCVVYLPFLFLFSHIQKRNFEENFKFLFYLCLNFLIFSSYNYILNFLDYGNFISNQAAYLEHSFYGGIKGFIFNFLNFVFRFFDFTGTTFGIYLNVLVLNFKAFVFSLLNLGMYDVHGASLILDTATDEQYAGFGLVGIFAILPSLYKSFCQKKKLFFFLLAIMFVLDIVILSCSMQYMTYSMRFIVAFCTLFAPCFIFVYSKKGFYKWLLVIMCAYNLVFIPQFITRAPFHKIIKNLKENNFNLEKYTTDFFEGKITPNHKIGVDIKHILLNRYKDKKNVAYFRGLSNATFNLKLLKSHNVDFLSAYKIDKYNLQKYDVIILEGEIQEDNVFKTSDIDLNYKIQNNAFEFPKYNKAGCFFVDNFGKYCTKPNECVERNCFSRRYM